MLLEKIAKILLKHARRDVKKEGNLIIIRDFLGPYEIERTELDVSCKCCRCKTVA